MEVRPGGLLSGFKSSHMLILSYFQNTWKRKTNIERTMILRQALTSHSLFPYNSQWPLEESHFTDEQTGTGGEGTHLDL